MTGAALKRGRRDRGTIRPAFTVEAEAALILRKLARHHLDGPIPTDHDPCRPGEGGT